MKIKYNKTLIGGFNDLGEPLIVTLDESLFVHNETWVFGGIETKYRKLRLSITKIRSAAALENFIYENFKEGIHFTHDGWAEYSFLDNNINYNCKFHFEAIDDIEIIIIY